MTLRPRIDEETVDKLDEELDDVMAVDPRTVGLDKKIDVLIEELRNERHSRRLAENQAEQDQGGFR